MAKRDSGASTFNKIVASVPREANFEITMNGDSTTEVWDDIDTNLDEGMAWLIYGGEYSIEAIAPTVPQGSLDITANTQTHVLQVHRNTDNELLVNVHDDDLMFFDKYESSFVATAAGTSHGPQINWPRRFGKRTITFAQQLRVIFRTTVDNTIISDPAVQLVGCLYYDIIKAPNVGQSKLGQLANL